MPDKEKTKAQLAAELAAVSRRFSKLEKSYKTLQQSEARYKNFVENAIDSCLEYDLSGKCTFCNESAYKSLGYSREEYMQTRHRERFTSQDDADRVFTVFNEVYRTGVPVKAIITFFCKDGELKTSESVVSLIRGQNGKPVGFRSIARDITERKKSEAERERHSNFIENIEDGCYETDLAGYPTFSNEAIRRMIGYSQEELARMTVTDYSSPEEAQKIIKIFKNIYLTGEPVKMYNHVVIRKDGEIRILNASASLIRDAFGKPVGFRGTTQDITEQKRMESEQEKLKEQLMQAQKMEAIGTLAGGIAHDFNNLLMGIQGYVSLMLLDTNPSHPHYERLKTIETQVQSGADLTRQLLGFARGGRYEIKPTNLNDLVSRTAGVFGRTKKEISVFQKYARDIKIVEVDQIQIEQVLLSLFVNAWQAMPGGGSIYLETANVFLEESYVKSYEIKPGPYVKISVTDTGMGMDAKVRERIFEPFFTTKEMGRGSGLGLAAAYGIIKGHSGLIDVKSERGQGTTFCIYLPVSDKKVESREKSADKIMAGKETVLVVDDERIITDVTGELLSGLGYKVLTASSGEEAVDIYKANKDKIDLVILDMIMPGIGGGEAFDRIMTVNSDARIILSSGYSLTGHAKEIMSRGARAFLQKPFHLEELSQKVRDVLEG